MGRTLPDSVVLLTAEEDSHAFVLLPDSESDLRSGTFENLPQGYPSDLAISGTPHGVMVLRLRHSLLEEIAKRPVNLRSESIVWDSAFASLTSLLMEDLSEGSKASALYQDELMRTLAARAVQLWGNGSTSKPVGGLRPEVETVVRIIEDHPELDHGLNALAKGVGLSPSQLGRSFRQATGYTLHQFVIRTRLAHALHLLRSTHMPLNAIAERCGFYDQGHMTRHFRRHYGQNPSSVRENKI